MELDSVAPKIEKKSERDDEDEDKSAKGKRAGRASLRLVESRSDKEDKRQSAAKERAKEAEKPPLELFKTPSSEIKTASKEEVPNEEEVSENEKPLAIRALAAEEAGAIPEHSAEEIADNPEAAADIAAKEMLEEAAETGDIEAAQENAAAKLGASTEELIAIESQIEAEINKEQVIEAEASDASDTEVTAEETAQPEGNVEEVVFDRSAEELAGEAGEDEPEDATSSTPLAAPSPGPGGAGGSGGVPPSGPRSPFGSGLPPQGPGLPAIPTLSGNLYHTPITPDSPAVERYDQGNPAVMALIGGIIGYFIGRRRGRIKTEKRLLPIQKKLEKQVEDLHWQVKRKEMAVRRLAAEKVRQNGPFIIEAVAARQAIRSEHRDQKQARPLERRATERRPAPEASQLHGSGKAQEHIGHMLITAESSNQRVRQPAESVPATKVEQSRHEQIPEHLRQRHVETLNRAELLSLSEKIIVDGTSLRQIYETHLIGERGLRRLVAEYLRGGEVKKILRREIIEHEIDFERDPAMRDLPSHTSAASQPVMAPSKVTLNQLVERASAGLGYESDALAYYKARAAYEAQENQEQDNQRRLVDIAMVTTITILITVIILLYLTRH